MPADGNFQYRSTSVSTDTKVAPPAPDEEFAFVSAGRYDLLARESLDEWCGIKDCRSPQWDKMPLCQSHAFDLWTEVEYHRMDLRQAAASRMRKQSVEQIRSEIIKERMGVEKFMAEYKQKPGLIYYLRVADQIKIGYTADLPTRMKSYPPMAELLATHPGTRATERQMHQKFVTHRAARNEWFHPHDKLLTHIDLVRDQYSQERP